MTISFHFIRTSAGSTLFLCAGLATGSSSDPPRGPAGSMEKGTGSVPHLAEWLNGCKYL
jgi:hypothetical protein